MATTGLLGSNRSRETAGFLVSVGFVGLAAVRDVYLGGLFQRTSPLLLAIVAMSLCTVVFLPTALVDSRESFAVLRRRPRDLFWVNLTSAGAWLAFLYALRLLEPSLVQILYSGIGPLSVIWFERQTGGAVPGRPLTHAERLSYLGLAASLAFSAGVALSGLSGVSQSFGSTALGVVLAAGGGISISVSTMFCRNLNDAGVTPSALLSLRYPATVLAAAALAALSPSGLPSGLSWIDAVMVIASLLIIVPSYVNQVAISLASPLTVRVVLSVGPVLIFLFQLIEGRLAASSYSLAATIVYVVAAISATRARRCAIRSADAIRVATLFRVPGDAGGIGLPRHEFRRHEDR